MISADTPAKTADEVADVLIMMLDYAARKDINIHLAISRKMAINQNRKWATNALGVNQHVSE
jgi:NTP pyrophosphatase (non-canonical NTP hydrolase)